MLQTKFGGNNEIVCNVQKLQSSNLVGTDIRTKSYHCYLSRDLL